MVRCVSRCRVGVDTRSYEHSAASRTKQAGFVNVPGLSHVVARQSTAWLHPDQREWINFKVAVFLEKLKSEGVMVHREPEHNMSGVGTYSVEIGAERLKQTLIILEGIIVASVYFNRAPHAPLVGVNP